MSERCANPCGRKARKAVMHLEIVYGSKVRNAAFQYSSFSCGEKTLASGEEAVFFRAQSQNKAVANPFVS